MKRTQELQIERKKFTFWLVINAGIHLFVLFSAMLYQYYWGAEKKQPTIVNVSLVSLPGPGGLSLPGSREEQGSDTEKKTEPLFSEALPEESETTRRNEPDPVVPVPESQPVKKTVPEKIEQKKPAEKEVQKPLVKSEPKPPVSRTERDDLNKAFDKLRKSVESKSSAARQQQRQDNIGNALERLNQKVALQGRRQGSGTGGGSGGVGASVGSGRGGGEPLINIKLK